MENETLSDVWKLETPAEDIASDHINYLYEQARAGKVGARNIIKKCFEFSGDDWQEIKKKMETEGSVWYVWYMCGVGEYIKLYGI